MSEACEKKGESGYGRVRPPKSKFGIQSSYAHYLQGIFNDRDYHIKNGVYIAREGGMRAKNGGLVHPKHGQKTPVCAKWFSPN